MTSLSLSVSLCSAHECQTFFANFFGVIHFEINSVRNIMTKFLLFLFVFFLLEENVPGNIAKEHEKCFD